MKTSFSWVNSSNNVVDLKQKLDFSQGIPMEQQRLIFEHKQLEICSLNIL